MRQAPGVPDYCQVSTATLLDESAAVAVTCLLIGLPVVHKIEGLTALRRACMLSVHPSTSRNL